MTHIDVVTALWTGFPGGPGTSTFHLKNETHDLTGIQEFFGNLAGIIPDSVAIQVQNSGATIEDTTGDLVDTWAAESVAVVAGSNGTKYASGVGAVIQWDTGFVIDKRALVGHTYMVPIYGGAFDTNGTLNSDDLALIQTAATTLVSAYVDAFLAWHRPRK